MRWFWNGICLGIALTLTGCSESLAPPKRSGEPIGVQFMRTEPAFAGTAFRVLLDFESPGDLAFIGEGSSTQLDPAVAHTGGASLQIPAHTNGFVVKVNANLLT